MAGPAQRTLGPAQETGQTLAMGFDDVTARMATFDKCIAERDVDLARTVLDGDYTLIIAKPVLVTMPRDRWLEVLPDYIVHDYALESQHVDVDGDHAVVLQTVSMQATVLGHDRGGAFVSQTSGVCVMLTGESGDGTPRRSRLAPCRAFRTD